MSWWKNLQQNRWKEVGQWRRKNGGDSSHAHLWLYSLTAMPTWRMHGRIVFEQRPFYLSKKDVSLFIHKGNAKELWLLLNNTIMFTEIHSTHINEWMLQPGVFYQIFIFTLVVSYLIFDNFDGRRWQRRFFHLKYKHGFWLLEWLCKWNTRLCQKSSIFQGLYSNSSMFLILKTYTTLHIIQTFKICTNPETTFFFGRLASCSHW